MPAGLSVKDYIEGKEGKYKEFLAKTTAGKNGRRQVCDKALRGSDFWLP